MMRRVAKVGDFVWVHHITSGEYSEYKAHLSEIHPDKIVLYFDLAGKPNPQNSATIERTNIKHLYVYIDTGSDGSWSEPDEDWYSAELSA